MLDTCAGLERGGGCGPLHRETSPTISVIVAFRNPGPHFQSAIQSVLAQTFQHWELILLDDGSSDGSVEYARGIDDPRVRVLSDGHSLNLPRRLNQLIDLAQAPYIARMDADDVMHPDRLKRQIEILSHSERNTVVGSSAVIIDEDSHIVGVRAARSVQRHGCAAAGSFIHPTVAASTEWFRRHRYSENPSFFRSEDAELWIRTSGSSRFVNIPEPLLFYREKATISIEKYAGSTLGGVVLGTRLAEDSKLSALRVVTTNLMKLWLMSAVDILRLHDAMPRRQCAPMPDRERREAEKTLRWVVGSSVPLCVRMREDSLVS